MKRCTIAAGAIVLGGSVVVAHAQITASEAQPPLQASSVPGKQSLKAANRKLQKAVLSSLTRTRGLKAGNVLVVARGGIVTLAGSVPDADQVELAMSATRAVNGVSEVRNNLAIRPEGL
ncbi:BON domain-containing protein [Paraburkholderia strydomiana]|nr:BON domain-containing protein [Paraburkholderia strydomiana]